MQALFVIKLPATVKKEREWYVSSCPILDVHSQGETQTKALQNLTQALKLFFVSCFERGTLDEVLKNCGFEPLRKETETVHFPKRYKTVDVPIPFKTPAKFNPASCHA